MSRWLLNALLLAVIGLLGLFVGLSLRVMREGIPVRLAGPLTLEGPVSVKLAQPVGLADPIAVEVRELPLVIPSRFSVEVGSPVQAETGFLACPKCPLGLVIPVRFNLLSGAITWRCTACGYEFGP
ncbi:MAG: hypothetical protein NZ651_01395 [Candidatus Bipolaricaulota bacterium]|nr:hypothetical protein [Candidatus Bipolaricaulota bacterium]MDW8126422.1 hypothetical protein [Candidatus Bipolaricaulota bacterium]